MLSDGLGANWQLQKLSRSEPSNSRLSPAVSEALSKWQRSGDAKAPCVAEAYADRGTLSTPGPTPAPASGIAGRSNGHQWHPQLRMPVPQPRVGARANPKPPTPHPVRWPSVPDGTPFAARTDANGKCGWRNAPRALRTNRTQGGVHTILKGRPRHAPSLPTPHARRYKIAPGWRGLTPVGRRGCGWLGLQPHWR